MVNFHYFNEELDQKSVEEEGHLEIQKAENQYIKRYTFSTIF